MFEEMSKKQKPEVIQAKRKMVYRVEDSVDGPEKDFYANVTVETKKLEKTYPELLKDERLNDVGFTQKQTNADKTVEGQEDNRISEDLIIIVRREPTTVQSIAGQQVQPPAPDTTVVGAGAEGPESTTVPEGVLEEEK